MVIDENKTIGGEHDPVYTELKYSNVDLKFTVISYMTSIKLKRNLFLNVARPTLHLGCRQPTHSLNYTEGQFPR